MPRDARPSGIDETVDRIAAQHSLSPTLIHSVIKVESNYNPLRGVVQGRQGLMQLIPATARRFGVANVFNPIENIQGGAKYLKYLLDLYHNDYALALAAYNAGEGAVATLRRRCRLTRKRKTISTWWQISSRSRKLWKRRPARPNPKVKAV